MREAHIFVSGKVQGVAFRHHAKKRASELGIVGYVKNLPNGMVEVVAQGGRDPLTELLIWCKGGPDWAEVDQCSVTWKDVDRKTYESFEIVK